MIGCDAVSIAEDDQTLDSVKERITYEHLKVLTEFCFSTLRHDINVCVPNPMNIKNLLNEIFVMRPLHEDDDSIVIVDLPSFCVIHGSPPNLKVSIANGRQRFRVVSNRIMPRIESVNPIDS